MCSVMYKFETNCTNLNKVIRFNQCSIKLKVFKKGEVSREECLRIVFTSFSTDTYRKCQFFLFKPSKYWEADYC